MTRTSLVISALILLTLNACASNAVRKIVPVGSKIAFIDDSSSAICVDYKGPTIFNNKKYSIPLTPRKPSQAEAKFASYARQAGFEPLILDPESALDANERPFESLSKWVPDVRISDSFMKKTGNRLRENGVTTIVLFGGGKRTAWHREKPDERCVGISANLSTQEGVHIFPEPFYVFDLETGRYNTIANGQNDRERQFEKSLDKKAREIATFQWGEISADKVDAVRAFHDELVDEALFDLLSRRLNPAVISFEKTKN